MSMVDDLNSLQDFFNRFVALHNVTTSEYNPACCKHYSSINMSAPRALAGNLTAQYKQSYRRRVFKNQ